jgi:hypothetical protein
MAQLYKATLQRQEKLQQYLNGKYVVMWECDWDRLVLESEEVKEFVKNFELPTPLSIRSALAGGRTEAIYVESDCDLRQGESIQYLDFCVSFFFLNK